MSVRPWKLGFVAVGLSLVGAAEPGSGLALEVQVFDPLGKPAPRAYVRALPLPSGGQVRGRAADAAGKARVEKLQAGKYRFWAELEGYQASAPADVEVQPGAPVSARLTLRPGLTVQGRVLDDRGRPVEGASVGVQVVRPEGDFSIPAEPESTGRLGAKSDAQGRFALVGLGPRAYRLHAVHPRYRWDATSDVQVTPGDPDPTLVLGSSGHVKGRVTLGGQPVKRTTIDGVQREGPAFDLALSPGKHALRIEGAFATVWEAVDVEAGGFLDLGEVKVSAGQKVSGEALFAGKPAAGLVVRLAPAADERGGARTLTCGADGKFQFDKVGRGRYLLTGERPGLLARKVALEVRDQPVAERLEARAFGSVEGKVFDPAGQPLSGATVSLPGGEIRGLSGEGGAYRLDGIFPGKVRLLALRDLAAAADGPPTEVDVEVPEGGLAKIDVRIVERGW